MEDYKIEVRELIGRYREKIWSLIPGPDRARVGKELKELEELIMEARAPRIAVVGRRGAGKSSLINAIFNAEVAAVGAVKSTTGRGRWYEYAGERGKLEILDTRGLGEGSAPAEESDTASALGEIAAAVSSKCPDAILFLCKAKEVDARIDEDLKNLGDILKLIEKTHGYRAPVVGVVTQVDELDPVEVLPPYEDETKLKNIEQAQEQLREKLAPLAGEGVAVIPTSAYMRFEGGRVAADRRWNIDALVEYLTEKLPRSAQLELARISRVKSVQRKLAQAIIAAAVATAGAVGAQPIPVADLPVLTGIQASMIIGIGYVAGRRLDSKSVKEFMGALGLNVGAAFALREMARALVKLFPVAGNVISGTVAAGGTWAIGQAATAYFVDERKLKEVKKIYRQNKKKAKRNLPEEAVLP
ncbi:MAG TPA: 50S ribosome-binding GTPase [Bacillota bacterium]|nr:50S ribosome-binding GTPase [Bacillota bacterium]